MKLSALFLPLRARVSRVFVAAVLIAFASAAVAQSSKIQLTLTPTTTSKTYGDDEPKRFNYTLDIPSDATDNLNAIRKTANRNEHLRRAPGEDAGSYAFSLPENADTVIIKGGVREKYTIVLAPGSSFTITPKEVTYTSTSADKVYDSTPAAPADLGGSFAAEDIVSGDENDVDVTGGTYQTKVSPFILPGQAGEDITIAGFALSGDKAGNYSLAGASSVTGDVTPKSLTLADVKLTKAQGGGTSTTGATVEATITGLVAGHTGTLALVPSPTAEFASAAAGDNIGITGLTGAQLVLTVTGSGGTPVASANYALPSGAITATGQITSTAIQAPDAPGAPTLTADFQSIKVSWTAPNDNGNSITDNRVRWRTAAASGNPAGDWNGAGNNGVLTGGIDTNFTITGLTNGTAYDVQVAAVNGGGIGDFSPSASSTPVANNANLASLAVTGSDNNALTLAPVFDAATEAYTVTVAAGIATVTVTATAADAAAATLQLVRTVSGTAGAAQTLTGGSASSAQALIRGDTTLAVTVTAGDSSTTKTYTVVLTRPNGPPGAPNAPTVSAGSAAGTLAVSWSAPTDTGGSAITGYAIRQGEEAASPTWSDVTHSGTATTATITGLDSGKTYEVQIAAINALGTGPWSASGKGSPVAAQDNADISALTVVDSKGGTVALTPAFDAGTVAYTAGVANDITGVRFTATFLGSGIVIGGDADNDPATGVQSTAVAINVGEEKAITLIVTAQDGSTTKTYTVTVTRAAGVPAKPADPSVARSSTVSRSVDVTWTWSGGADNNGSAVTAFHVQWRKPGDSNWLPDATGQVISDPADRSYAVTGLEPGENYQARVRAVNAIGNSKWSDTARAKASGPPAKPTSTPTLSAFPGGLSVNAPSSNEDDGGSAYNRNRVFRYRLADKGDGSPGEWQTQQGTNGGNIAGLTGGSVYDVQYAFRNGFASDNTGPFSDTGKGTPTRRDLTLTPMAASKVYGEADPVFDYTANSFFGSGVGKNDVFTAVPFERVPGEDAGEYAFRLKNPVPWVAAGNVAGQYNLITTLGGSAKFTITAKEVTYTSTAADKVYDGDRDAPDNLGGSFTAGVVTATVNGVAIDDTAADKLSVGGGLFADKAAGDDKTVTQFALEGSSKDNYSLASGSSVTGDIRQLATTLTLGVRSRVYDATTDTGTVTPAFSPEIISGDEVTVDVSGAVYADANAGTGKTINGVADAQIGGADKDNYDITIVATGEVTKRPLRVAAGGSGNALPSAAALGDRSLLTIASGVSGEGLVGTDTAATVLSGSIERGTETGSAPRFTSPLTIGTLAASDNYELFFTAGEFIRTSLQTLVVTPVEKTRVYGAADPAAFTYTVAPNSGSNYVTGDDENTVFFTAGQAVVRRVAGDDAGRYSFSLVDPLPLADSGDSAKYIFIIAPGSDYEVTPKELGATAIVLTKTYDSLTAITGATLSGGALSGAVGSEVVTLTLKSDAGGNYAAADVGTGIVLSGVDNSDFELDATSPAKATNYRLTTNLNLSGVITAKEVAVAQITLTKAYDGNVEYGASSIKTGSGEITGEAGSEELVLTPSAAGQYDLADAGTRTFTGAQFTLAAAGGNAKPGNYELPASFEVNGEITPKEVTVGDITVTKTFDDSDSMAGVELAGGAVTGAIGTQTFTLQLAAANDGTFDSPDAATTIGVTGADFELVAPSGDTESKPANYTLPALTINGVIEPKALTFSGTATLRKVYDGNNVADPSIPNPDPTGLQVAPFKASETEVIGGVIGGAVGTNTFRLALVDGGNITYAQADVGEKLALNGVDAEDFQLQAAGDGNPANYTLPDAITAEGEITRRTVTVAEVTLTKTYDGSAAITPATELSGGELGNLVPGELLALRVVTGRGGFAQTGAGSDLSVPGARLRLADGAGGKADNYALPATLDIIGVIEPRAITIVAPQLTKEYDKTTGFGDTKLVAGTGVVSGTLGEDALILAPTAGVYASAGVGENIIISGITWELRAAPGNSAEPGNYTFPASFEVDTETLVAGLIQPRTLRVSAGNTPTKEYDGTINAPAGFDKADAAALNLNGLLQGDDINFAEGANTYNSKNVLEATHITLNIGGAAAPNYRLENNAGIPAEITPKQVMISNLVPGSTAAPKVYDGTTDGPSGFTWSGSGGNQPAFPAGVPVPGDEGKLTFTLTGARYASKDVGTVTLIPILTGGADGDESANYEVQSGTSGEITKRPLRIAAKNAVGLDRAEAVLEYTLGSGVAGEGLVTGESADEVVHGALAVGSTANADGSFPIEKGTLYPTNNYEIFFTPALFFPSGRLDLDLSGAANGDEGIIIARYVFGLRGDALTAGITLDNTVDAATLETRLKSLVDDGTLDVDGNAGINGWDAILISRYLLGVTEAAGLTDGFAAGAVDADAAKTAVEALLPAAE
ncbi:MAG: YDG domain-containing protein [Gammaproteobacteria bacterium]|nr:YDG domain-containing protein [Gammaproteobacteria bacterium]